MFIAFGRRIQAAESELPRGSKAMTKRLLADARPTHDDEFKLPPRALHAAFTPVGPEFTRC